MFLKSGSVMSVIIGLIIPNMYDETVLEIILQLTCLSCRI